MKKIVAILFLIFNITLFYSQTPTYTGYTDSDSIKFSDNTTQTTAFTTDTVNSLIVDTAKTMITDSLGRFIDSSEILSRISDSINNFIDSTQILDSVIAKIEDSTAVLRTDLVRKDSLRPKLILDTLIANKLAIGTNAPNNCDVEIHSASGGNPRIIISDEDASQPFTSLESNTNTCGSIMTISSLYGGMLLDGYSSANLSAFVLRFLIGSNSPANPAGSFRFGKSNGATSYTNLANYEPLLALQNIDANLNYFTFYPASLEANAELKSVYKQTGTGYFKLGSVSSSIMSPVLWGQSESATTGLYNLIAPDDAGQTGFSTAAFYYNARTKGAAALTTGNLFEYTNNGTPIWTVDLEGTMKNNFGIESSRAMIEFDNTSAAGNTKVAVGCIGSPEANLSFNMDYSTGVHKLYDETYNAMWIFMNPNHWGMQYSQDTLNSVGDIWSATGQKYLFRQDTNARMLINAIPSDDYEESMLSIKLKESNYSHISGLDSLVLEGDRTYGQAANIWINRYNSGELYLSKGGGDINTFGDVFINSSLKFTPQIDSSSTVTKDTLYIDFNYNSQWYKAKADTIKLDISNFPTGKSQSNFFYIYYSDSTVVELLDSSKFSYINATFSQDSAVTDFINIATNPFDGKTIINVSKINNY